MRIIICVLLAVVSVQAQEKPLDFWGESPRLFTVTNISITSLVPTCSHPKRRDMLTLTPQNGWRRTMHQ